MGSDETTSRAPGSVVTAPDREPVLQVNGVSKRYDGVQALSRVTIDLARGEVLGLVGENGAGKSTLLGILNGNVLPDEGTVTLRGEQLRLGHPSAATEQGIATVYQEQGLVPTLAAYENMFLGRKSHFTTAGFVQRRQMIASATRTLDALGVEVDPRARTADLSFAERQLVEIAKAFALTEAVDAEPIILLDEPTSALSGDEIELLLQNIQNWRNRASFIFVSHRLAHVLAVCERIAALKDGDLIADLSASDTTEGALHELIVGRKRDSEFYKERLQRTSVGNDVIARADALGDSRSFSDVSFQINSGEILGVAGVAGCGKSELARAVVGLEKYREGSLEVLGKRLLPGATSSAIKRGAAYIPAERTREGVIGIHSVATNMTLPLLSSLLGQSRVLVSQRSEKHLADDWIARLRIKTPNRSTQINRLSGGNQQKVVFAKWLARHVRLLVLDDPGRGLDVGAKEEIYGLLRELAEADVAILLVSDNLPELIGLSNRIITMRAGVVTAEIDAPSDAKPAETEVVRHMV